MGRVDEDSAAQEGAFALAPLGRARPRAPARPRACPSRGSCRRSTPRCRRSRRSSRRGHARLASPWAPGGRSRFCRSPGEGMRQRTRQLSRTEGKAFRNQPDGWPRPRRPGRTAPESGRGRRSYNAAPQSAVRAACIHVVCPVRTRRGTCARAACSVLPGEHAAAGAVELDDPVAERKQRAGFDEPLDAVPPAERDAPPPAVASWPPPTPCLHFSAPPIPTRWEYCSLPGFVWSVPHLPERFPAAPAGGWQSLAGRVMNPLDALDRILASLHRAGLDDAHWPATAALIDEACGIAGNVLVVGEGSGDDARVYFAQYLFNRGEPRPDLAREYFNVYHPHDEAMPRTRKLPAGYVAHAPDLYTEKELRTSPAYNEAWRHLPLPERLAHSPRLAGRPAHHLRHCRPGRNRGRLAVHSAPTDPISAAACPPARPRPSGAGWRRCAERQSGGPPGQQPDRRAAPGPRRARAGCQRSSESERT